MMPLLEFYSLHLILCLKLISVSSSIPSSTCLSHSFALCHGCLLSLILIYFSWVQFFNVLLRCASYIYIYIYIYILLWTLPFFKHILAHFSNPKYILMSILIAFTIFISFSKSSSLLPSSFKSSMYNKWLIFLSILCTWYPQWPLFSLLVSGISATQKSNDKREFWRNISLCIWMGCDCITSCFVFKWSIVFHFSIYNLQNLTILLFTPTSSIDLYPAMWNTVKCCLVIDPGYT